MIMPLHDASTERCRVFPVGVGEPSLLSANRPRAALRTSGRNLFEAKQKTLVAVYVVVFLTSFTWISAAAEERVIATRVGITHGRVTAIAVAPDGSCLILGYNDGVAEVLDLAGDDPVVTEKSAHKSAVVAIAVSSDSKLVALGEASGSIAVRKLDGFVPLLQSELTAHRLKIAELTFSPGGRWLVSADSYGVLVLWDMTEDEPPAISLRNPWIKFPIDVLEFSPDGRWLFCASNNSNWYRYDARLWELDTDKPRPTAYRLHANTNSFGSGAFSHSSQLLATANGDGAIRLWRLTVRDPSRKPFKVPGFSNAKLALTNDGETLVAVSNGGVRFVDLAQISTQQRWIDRYIRPHTATKIAISSDNRWLAVGTREGDALFWFLDGAELPVEPTAVQLHSQPIVQLHFSESGTSMMAAHEDGTVKFVDLNGQSVALNCNRVALHGSPIRTAFCTVDERWLVTVGQDWGVRLHRLNN